jgi:hypothetical protein
VVANGLDREAHQLGHLRCRTPCSEERERLTLARGQLRRSLGRLPLPDRAPEGKASDHHVICSSERDGTDGHTHTRPVGAHQRGLVLRVRRAQLRTRALRTPGRLSQWAKRVMRALMA